jgi:hypothetical protein
MDLDRDSLVYKAKLAEQAERFDEMVADMKEVARQVCISEVSPFPPPLRIVSKSCIISHSLYSSSRSLKNSQ